MRLTLTPTDQIVTLVGGVGGVQARVWTGEDEHGTRCDVFVTRVAVADSVPAEAQRRFADALLPVRPMAGAVNSVWPARLVL